MPFGKPCRRFAQLGAFLWNGGEGCKRKFGLRGLALGNQRRKVFRFNRLGAVGAGKQIGESDFHPFGLAPDFTLFLKERTGLFLGRGIACLKGCVPDHVLRGGGYKPLPLALGVGERGERQLIAGEQSLEAFAKFGGVAPDLVCGEQRFGPIMRGAIDATLLVAEFRGDLLEKAGVADALGRGSACADRAFSMDHFGAVGVVVQSLGQRYRQRLALCMGNERDAKGCRRREELRHHVCRGKHLIIEFRTQAGGKIGLVPGLDHADQAQLGLGLHALERLSAHALVGVVQGQFLEQGVVGRYLAEGLEFLLGTGFVPIDLAGKDSGEHADSRDGPACLIVKSWGSGA